VKVKNCPKLLALTVHKNGKYLLVSNFMWLKFNEEVEGMKNLLKSRRNFKDRNYRERLQCS
jgi:hypothetical protein